MARQVFHVSPEDGDKWRVEPEGGETGQVFEDKDEAFRHAKQMAQGAEGQVIVHGRDGRIQYENTYGEDPRQRKG